MEKQIIITILGSSGGLAKGVLSLLNKSIADSNCYIHDFLINCKIHLIDINQKEISYYEELFTNLVDRLNLHEFDLHDTEKFTKHLIDTSTDIVIDISWADTVEMISCCNKLGVIYINSALENYMVDEDPVYSGYGTSARNEIFEDNRSEFKDTKAIIGSGMNPGIVQWMAIELIKKNKNIPKACYIVEHDTSFFKDISESKKDTIYTSWSPVCFLDEAIDSFPLYMKNENQYLMYSEVYEQEFKITLGENKFYGCLVPHEEIISIGKEYGFESGFIYRINEHTTKLIKENIEDLDQLWENPMEVLDPSKNNLEGDDLVGVLLVYDNEEIYLYNKCNNEKIYKEYQINATYFQVACGIYAGVCSLILDEIPNGNYYVDELLLKTESQYGKYLSYYMKEFVVGRNNFSEGLLEDRIKR